MAGSDSGIERRREYERLLWVSDRAPGLTLRERGVIREQMTHEQVKAFERNNDLPPLPEQTARFMKRRLARLQNILHGNLHVPAVGPQLFEAARGVIAELERRLQEDKSLYSLSDLRYLKVVLLDYEDFAAKVRVKFFNAAPVPDVRLEDLRKDADDLRLEFDLELQKRDFDDSRRKRLGIELVKRLDRVAREVEETRKRVLASNTHYVTEYKPIPGPFRPGNLVRVVRGAPPLFQKGDIVRISNETGLPNGYVGIITRETAVRIGELGGWESSRFEKVEEVQTPVSVIEFDHLLNDLKETKLAIAEHIFKISATEALKILHRDSPVPVREFTRGDKVKVIAPHTAHGRSYSGECEVGDVGEVVEVRNKDLSVRWKHNSRRSTIDKVCVTFAAMSVTSEFIQVLDGDKGGPEAIFGPISKADLINAISDNNKDQLLRRQSMTTNPYSTDKPSAQYSKALGYTEPDDKEQPVEETVAQRQFRLNNEQALRAAQLRVENEEAHLKDAREKVAKAKFRANMVDPFPNGTIIQVVPVGTAAGYREHSIVLHLVKDGEGVWRQVADARGCGHDIVAFLSAYDQIMQYLDNPHYEVRIINEFQVLPDGPTFTLDVTPTTAKRTTTRRATPAKKTAAKRPAAKKTAAKKTTSAAAKR